MDPKGEGHVYAFDQLNGHVLWKYLAAPGVSADLLSDGSRVIAYSQSGELTSLDIATGKPNWKTKVTESTTADYLPAPVLIHGQVFAATLDGTLAAIDAKTGALLWKYALDPGNSLRPAAVGDELYVVSSAKRLYRVDKTRGDQNDVVALGAGPSYFHPIADQQSVFLELEDHTMKRISIQKQVIWSQKAEGSLTTKKPFLLDDDVIVADDKGQIIAFRCSDGAIHWHTRLRSLQAPITTIGSDGTNLLVGTQAGTLYALKLTELRKSTLK